MNKQTQLGSLLATALCSLAILSTSAMAMPPEVQRLVEEHGVELIPLGPPARTDKDIEVGKPFPADVFGNSQGQAVGGRGNEPTCRIVINPAKGVPSMTCEGVGAQGRRISCTSHEPPYTGALLAFSVEEGALLANMGEPEASCKNF